jgi:hypothetical protein
MRFPVPPPLKPKLPLPDLTAFYEVRYLKRMYAGYHGTILLWVVVCTGFSSLLLFILRFFWKLEGASAQLRLVAFVSGGILLGLSLGHFMGRLVVKELMKRYPRKSSV